MCEILDRVETRGSAKGMAEGMTRGMAKGRAEGKAEGKAEGMAEGMTKGEMQKAKEVALNLSKMGLTSDMIAKAVEMSVDTVRQWLEVAAN